MSIDTTERTGALIRTSIQLSPDHREQLERTARKQDRSMSYVIRRALDEYFSTDNDNPETSRVTGARS